MITALTAVGGRSENQDHFLYAEDTLIGLVAVVCDGMGGMAGGQEASQMATSTILEDLQQLNSDSDIPNGITAAVLHANERIYQAAQENPALKGMGTTVVVLVLNDKVAYLGHVGDSRIYHTRKGKVLFRTWDHSTVFKMLKEGILQTEEEARNHDRSNQLLRAVGVSPTVEVEVNVCEYRKGDLFLLCSDGICGELGDDLILQEFRKGVSLQDIASALVGLADQVGELSGGTHDNMRRRVLYNPGLPVLPVEQGVFPGIKSDG
jgi:serine/threonine protein phosphatase PrpC